MKNSEFVTEPELRENTSEICYSGIDFDHEDISPQLMIDNFENYEIHESKPSKENSIADIRMATTSEDVDTSREVVVLKETYTPTEVKTFSILLLRFFLIAT